MFYLLLPGVLFFLFTDPTYRDIKSFRAQASVFESALSNAKELQKVRDTILADYNSISPQDRDRLLKLLPNTVDNVRLVRDIDNIAARHDMTLRSVRVDIEKDANAVGPTTRQYGSAIVSFTVSAPYAALLAFLPNLNGVFAL